MDVVHILPGRHRRLEEGHPWVYRTEIAHVRGNPGPGAVVDVVDARGRFIGRGFWNPASMIAVRIVTRDPTEEVTPDLIGRRLEEAWAYRRRVVPDHLGACRVVSGEADGVPGLFVDRYGRTLVVQVLSAGTARMQQDLLDRLERLLEPDGIYLRNDAPVRELEGLPLESRWAAGPAEPRVWIEEYGVPFAVDVVAGQKTGHYLDQRDNRPLIRPLAQGARVLDAFCHTGGFAINAALGGAEAVVAVDTSAAALATLRENAARAGVAGRIDVVEANAFDFLRARDREGARYDLIILDPPPFARSRAALEGARRGYKEINLRALRLLAPGGFLVTCSCSYHMTPDRFRDVVAEAARDARRRLRLVAERAQGPDHPVVPGYPESHYLKCLIFEVR